MSSLMEPDTIIKSYGDLLDVNDLLVEFVYKINTPGSIHVENIPGKYDMLYNALVNFNFVQNETNTDEINKDTKIVFTEIGEKFYNEYKEKIEIRSKQLGIS